MRFSCTIGFLQNSAFRFKSSNLWEFIRKTMEGLIQLEYRWEGNDSTLHLIWETIQGSFILLHGNWTEGGFTATMILKTKESFNLPNYIETYISFLFDPPRTWILCIVYRQDWPYCFWKFPPLNTVFLASFFWF